MEGNSREEDNCLDMFESIKHNVIKQVRWMVEEGQVTEEQGATLVMEAVRKYNEDVFALVNGT